MPGEISRQYEGPPLPPDETECPACAGTGYRLAEQWARRRPLLLCVVCGGTGMLSVPRTEAH